MIIENLSPSTQFIYFDYAFFILQIQQKYIQLKSF